METKNKNNPQQQKTVLPPGIQIFINKQPFKAPKPIMSGVELKELGGIPKENKLYLEVPGPNPDKPIADNQEEKLRAGYKFYDLPAGVVGRSELLPSLKKELDFIQKEYPGSTFNQMHDGKIYLKIPSIAIPNDKWNTDKIDIVIIIPQGFPTKRPQGFFTIFNLKFYNGKKPRGMSSKPIGNIPHFYFCWCPKQWNHTRESLWRYVKFVEKRFWEEKS